ncbi:mannan endo-1,4-beta-mannosidase 7-like isoform X2 [Malus sylvestris]|uniref:mannan endo-1,4-beta-mannosidase 7-like isoform X2 n=1 Tax=Malus sylvestris TaxID=3752 RepID=UPI0021AC1FC2|nr:mannan endo-1,4-beta-mannosidase 7-like isoform X2 [Malus sylvestris]
MKHPSFALLLAILIHQQCFITPIHVSAAGDNFIRVRGVHFLLNGSPYYANGFNGYWLMYVASDLSQRHKVSSVFSEATSHGLTVARTWAFSDGGYRPLQLSPGSYNEQMFKTVLNRYNSYTGVHYKDDPTILAWELINEPRCTSDPSGRTIQAWIMEMASHVKSIDRNHLLEAGLEGFYGQAIPHRMSLNPPFNIGTDFIANNRIPGIDFATVHSYPDQWLSSSNDQTQLTFLNNWLNTHIQDAQNILRKPIFIAEFGKSWKDHGFTTYQRDLLFNMVYSKIYFSAKRGGAAAGGLFWQLLTEGMDSFRDGYDIVLSQNPSTENVIAQQSHKLNQIRKIFARRRNAWMWRRARAIRRAEWLGRHKGKHIVN